MGLFIWWLVKTWPHVRREENTFGSGQSNRFAFFLGAMCGLAALAVHSFMDFNLHIPANALAGVVLLALVASNARYATEQLWVRLRNPGKAVLSSVLAVMILALAFQAWRGIGETFWRTRAESLPYFSPERAVALEKAFSWEPQNFQTADDAGDCYRTQSLDGGDDYIALGQKALDWYAKAIRLNPHDGYAYLRTGMCLDWLGRSEQSGPAYSAAEAHDPNSYFVTANIGWHYVQIGDYPAAREWLIRSLYLEGKNNQIAQNYLAICEAKLAEKASGRPRLPLNY
jgi:tetratricopeptide (TPR) repeat protein